MYKFLAEFKKKKKLAINREKMMHNDFPPTGVGDAVERNPQSGKSFIIWEPEFRSNSNTLSCHADG